MVVQSTGTISIDQIQEMRDKVVIVLLPETPYYVGPVFIPAVECNHSALNTLKQYKTSIIAIHIHSRTCSPAIEGFIVKYVSKCMNQYLCPYSPYTHLICFCSSILFFCLSLAFSIIFVSVQSPDHILNLVYILLCMFWLNLLNSRIFISMRRWPQPYDYRTASRSAAKSTILGQLVAKRESVAI